MRPVTERDTREPGLRTQRDRALKALPQAASRDHMYEAAGRLANPDMAASAAMGHGLTRAIIQSTGELLAQLDAVNPYWYVVLPKGDEPEARVAVCLDDDDRLCAAYPRGRKVWLRGALKDLGDYAMLQVDDEQGRSLGTGWVGLCSRRPLDEARETGY